MQKGFMIISICLMVIGLACISLFVAAESKKSSAKAAIPDRAYLQKIWDTWATLDPAQEAQFHAPGRTRFMTSRRSNTTVGQNSSQV